MKAHGPGQSARLLVDVARFLTKQKMPYAVIGAMAAAVHGSIRATTDADALVQVSPGNLRSLEKALIKAGFETEVRQGDPEDPIPALIAVSDRHGNRVDLLAGLRGLDPETFARTLAVEFLDTTIQVVSREDFIAMKCFAAGPQDLADARQALQAADEPVDLDLLRRVTRRFGRPAADALEELLAAD